LGRAKNSVRIEKLKIVNEYSEKIVNEYSEKIVNEYSEKIVIF
jgi:hypothetical protein